MNNEQVKGNVQQMSGKIKEMWGRLTDDEIALYSGQRDQFFGKLTEKYGIAKEEAEKRMQDLNHAA